MNILIMGGSSDTGLNLAKYLTTKGNNVIVSYYHHPSKIDSIEFIKCNIEYEEEITNTMEYILNKYGSIDVLINMAAISQDNYYLDKTKEEFMKVLEINLVGSFLCNKVYSKYISNGMIVNIASTDGIDTGSIYNLDYSTSKSGIITMSKIIASEGKNKVICICPNWLDSNTTRSIDQTYLQNELLRIKQSRLITLDEFSESVYKIINNKQNGVYQIDIKDDKLWIEKV